MAVHRGLEPASIADLLAWDPELLAQSESRGLDPWGSAYEFRRTDANAVRLGEFVSAGPDEELGTADDLRMAVENTSPRGAEQQR